MFASWYAGRFGPKHGYFFTLRLGFIGMTLMMRWRTGPASVPLLAYYIDTGMGHLALWVPSMCLTWPTFQALLSREQLPGEAPAQRHL